MIRRRTVLHILSSLIAWGTFSRKTAAQAVFGDEYTARVRAVAGAVLPREIGTDGCARAAHRFMDWVRNYRAGADADHEYGSSRLNRMPASPTHHYATQLDDLDRRSEGMRTGGTFASASLVEQQRAVTEAVVAAGVKELPARPDGGHIATDLMTHYFNSPDANDLAYGRFIGRFACRGLPESDKRPPVLEHAGDAQ
jgi:hypothetical protein